MRDVILPSNYVSGRVRLCRVPRTPFGQFLLPLVPDKLGGGQRPRFWGTPNPWDHNDWVKQWGAIVGRQLAEGDVRYRISGMYLEFENVSDPDDVVDFDPVSRSQARSYYDGLIDDPIRDYLRVPMIATAFEQVDPDDEDSNYQLRFFAQTSGVIGIHGKEFSDAVNSKVFGGALVAMVDSGDATQDLILSRFYATSGNQMVKLASGQIGAEWETLLQ